MKEPISDEKKRIDVEIGRRIKQRREEIGLSSEQLANELHFANYSAVWKLETGMSALRCHSLDDVAKALGTSIGYILGKTEVVKSSEREKSISELASLGELMPDDDLKIILDLAWALYRKNVNISKANLIKPDSGENPDA